MGAFEWEGEGGRAREPALQDVLLSVRGFFDLLDAVNNTFMQAHQDPVGLRTCAEVHAQFLGYRP